MSQDVLCEHAPVGNERLRAAIEESGKTYEEIAARIGVNPKTPGRWVNEGRAPYRRHRRAVNLLLGRDGDDPELWADLEEQHPRLVAEADLFDTMELGRLASASDIGAGTVDTVRDAVELLCRAYPVTPALDLVARTSKRLAYVVDLLGRRLTLDQHRDLLVEAGWLAALLGCVHFDVGNREDAEAARQSALRLGTEAGHGELMGWAHEMSAWFALVESRWEDLIGAARAGQAVAGTSSAMVQLVLQEAKGLACLGDRRAARQALDRGIAVLDRLPVPDHADNHFVFDRTKMSFYAAAIHTMMSDDDPAEEHAQHVIDCHTRPDGTSNAPMRVADCRMDLAMVRARRGDLDAAVDQGIAAFGYDRRSELSLLRRGRELAALLHQRYPNEPVADPFHEQLALVH